MENRIQRYLPLAVCFLIVGNLIGAGILALPINTGLAGLLPSLIGMIILGGAMFFSAIVLSREASQAQLTTFNYPSLYHKYLGALGKWIAILANMLILYGLLVAYLTGGATILSNLFHIPASLNWLLMIIIFILLTGLALSKTHFILKYNALIMIVLFICFAAITLQAERYIHLSHYRFHDWKFLPAAAPIIVTAFHFHNIIPNVCRSLNWRMPVIWKTIFAGMFIGFLINALWIQVGIGVLPLDNSATGLITAFEKNLPSTVPLDQIINTPFFLIASLIFALLAIATSYLANGLGLLGFVEDMTINHLHIKNRLLANFLTFGPPLLISLIYPDIFLQAINLVGGVGIVILFGILPGIIFIIKSSTPGRKILGIIMLVIFTFCLVFEIGQETGLLKIKPEIEHWEPNVGQIKR